MTGMEVGRDLADVGTETLIDDLREIFGRLEQAGAPFVVLRQRRLDAATVYDGDYDFLIDDRVASSFLREMLDALIRSKRFFLLQSPAQPDARKYTFRVFESATGRHVTLEFWKRYVIGGGPLPDALRWQDLDWAIARRAPGYHLREEVSALLFVAHLQAKGKSLNTPLVVQRSRRYRSDLAHIAGRTGLADAALEILEGLESGALEVEEASRQALTLLAQAGGRRPARSRAIPRMVLDHARAASRRLTQRTVAIMGPDGSGKSTLVAALIEHAAPGAARSRVFKHLFRRRLLYKVAMRARPGRGREQRNVWDERMGPLLALLAAPAYVVELVRCRGRTVVFDRYFYDFLMIDVRQQRKGQRITPPRRLRLRRLIPTPGLLINPLAEHEATSARRDALTKEGFENYERQMLSLVAECPPTWFAHIPSCHGLEECTSFAQRAAQRSRVLRRGGEVGGSGKAWRGATPTAAGEEAEAQPMESAQ
jgi:thymidylate kinase